MGRLFDRRIVISLLLVGIAAVSSLRAASELRSARNNYFEVIGLDLRSVSYVNELSDFSMKIAQRYLEREGLAFPQPILISLRPEAHSDFEGDYRIRIAERNAVQLDLRWEESMTLQQTCRAIAEAMLVQYSIYNFGSDASKNLRVWPVEALASEIHYGLRPSKFLVLLKRAREHPGLPLAEIAERFRSSTLQASDAGYWLFAAMKSSGLKRAAVVGLFQQAIAGIDIEETLISAVQPTAPTAEALTGQAWFLMQMEALLDQEYDVIEPMDVSRDWLAALAGLNTAIELESGSAKLNLRSLWKHRSEPAVQELVQARYEILLLRMARVNPAYFNPARSLGVLFEGILRDAPAHTHLHHLTIYLSDWEDAKEMQAEVLENL